MTRDEDEAQEVVAHRIVHRFEIRPRLLLPRLQLATDFDVFTPGQRSPTQEVDGAMFGGGHEPGPRVVGHARPRPPLEGHHERILGQLLGETDIPDDSGQARDQSRPLDPEDGIDRSVGVGNRHGCRSHHLHSFRARL